MTLPYCLCKRGIKELALKAKMVWVMADCFIPKLVDRPPDYVRAVKMLEIRLSLIMQGGQ